MLTIAAIADTHMFHANFAVPDADILIHAGDMCRIGTLEELAISRDFLAALPHRYKIVVAGNHDRAFEDQPDAARKMFEKFIYLEDQACTIEGITFYGSPWTPAFNEWAFNLPRGAPLAEKWAQIPDDIDVLITHGPPFGIGDKGTMIEGREGCRDLLLRVQQLAPKLHIFGHIHQDHGRWDIDQTAFINVTTDECMCPATLIQYQG